MIAVYPGSFDPITMGHVDIIHRISVKFKTVHVLVAESTDKVYMFTPEERVSFLEQSLSDLNNIKFHLTSGLTVDFADELKADVIVRGIRAVSDFEYEMVMANMNKNLAPKLETMIIFANPKFNFVSSRLVKEIASHNRDLKGLIPDCVLSAFQKKFAK
ncbi:MAG: pantetheine-phosphate adenylyltransferase [Bdellovibrionaceae bacterium]|nr:pantetheine-phosphate adenylyltransferase [Pseudobdellovibrionaceae bacterium]